MKKKFLAALLGIACALCCAFGFTACGGGDTGDGGSGGNKTEQTTPNEKPSNSDKTEQTTPNEKPGNDDDKKPDNSDENKTDDKTGDDKTNDDKKPDGSDDDKTVDQSEAFKAITDALQAKLDVKYGEGAEIMTIYTLGDFLACKVKYVNAIKDVRTTLPIKYFMDDNSNITDIEKVCDILSRSTLTERNEVDFVGLYLTDSENASDKIVAEKMIENRVGTSYDIICGAVSATKDLADDYQITNPAQIMIYALIAKDGKVYEYTETLIVTKDNGNVYDTVIDDNGSFRSKEHDQTELGALANNYYAEQLRLAEIKNELKKDYQAVIDALKVELDKEYGNGMEIQSIYTYVSARRSFLAMRVKYGNTVSRISTNVLTSSWLDENGYITNVDNARNAISTGTFTEESEFVGLYLSDSENAVEAALVNDMIKSRVGTDYDIICGGVSAVTDVSNDSQISNAAKFTVYALLADKDGKVSEYTQTLIATKDNGSVYDEVLNNGSFRSETKTQTELGALADKYYAVMR